MQETPDGLDEYLLVVRCQAGHEIALEEIVRGYSNRLRYYLLKLLGNRDAAEDTAQDVWLDVYQRVVQLRDPSAFRLWFYRIARERPNLASITRNVCCAKQLRGRLNHE